MDKYIYLDLEKAFGSTGDKIGNVSKNMSKTFGSALAGMEFLRANSSNSTSGAIFCVVEGEEAKFVNLFGVFVDVTSLSLAFGYFPNSNSFIKLPNQNLKEIFESYLLEGIRKKDREGVFDNIEIDYKYVIEIFKTKNLQEAKDSIFEYIKGLFDSDKDSLCTDYDSLLLNIIASKERFISRMGEPDTYAFLKRDKFERSIDSFIRRMYYIGGTLEELAKYFFWPFIAEDDFIENLKWIKGNLGNIKKLHKRVHYDDIMKSGDGSLEKLYQYYINQDVPSEFLNACISYGIGIKDRNLIHKSRVSENYMYLEERYKRMYDWTMEKVSSMSYIIESVSYGSSKNDSILCLCSNIIDLLRCSGWLDYLMYSVDMIRVYKNRTLYDSIIKKTGIRDILEESLVREVDFVKAINRYIEFYYLYNSGSMYRMRASINKFNFSSYTKRQLDNVGPMLENSVGMVLKKFVKDG